MKEKPFYKLPYLLYYGKRSKWNPLRYIFGENFSGITGDIKKWMKYQDLDVKDIKFTSNNEENV